MYNLKPVHVYDCTSLPQCSAIGNYFLSIVRQITVVLSMSMMYVTFIVET